MPTPLPGISASKGSAICGVNKYKSTLVAWLEIMEERQPGFCFNNGYELPLRSDPWELPLNPKFASLRWGSAMEDSICDLVGNVINREKIYKHPEYDWITTHVDGELNGRNQENKTAFVMAYEKGWGEPGSNMIPKEYMIQIQHQMMLTGQKFTDVNVLVFPKAPAEWEKMGYRVNMFGGYFSPETGDHDMNEGDLLEFANNLKSLGYFHQYHVEADKELQDEILKIYLTFWNENVLKEVPPPINGYDDIKWLIASPEGEIEATPEMKSLWSEKCDIENEIDSMLKRKDEIKDTFAKHIQIEIESKNIKPGHEDRKLNIFAGALKLGSITRSVSKVSVNKKMVSKIKDDSPVIYEQMKKTSFLDLFPETVDLTEKQLEKIKKVEDELEELSKILESSEELPKDFYEKIKNTRLVQSKILKSLKLTKILSKDSIIRNIEQMFPEMYTVLYETSIIEETTPKSVLRLSKSSED